MKCKLNVPVVTDFLYTHTHCHTLYKYTQNILNPYFISVDALHT